MDERPIGVFDSGIGGISALRNMARLMPGEKFIYYGDDANAPYGTRDEADILRLAWQDVNFLIKRDVKAIVIACNTATSAAANDLRQKLAIPVIGMEPALKPASAMRARGWVAVMATSATLSQEKFGRLMSRYGAHAVPLASDELVKFVERGEIAGEALDSHLKKLFENFIALPIDAVVLGCTHFVFLANAISRALPGVPLVDGNEGTAKQLRRVLAGAGALSEAGEGYVEMHTSGDARRLLPIMRALYALPIHASP